MSNEIKIIGGRHGISFAIRGRFPILIIEKLKKKVSIGAKVGDRKLGMVLSPEILACAECVIEFHKSDSVLPIISALMNIWEFLREQEATLSGEPSE